MTDANGSKAPTALSLFSGIGGLDYGLSLAGFRHVGFCEGGGDPNGTKAEREQWTSGKWRRSILAARWPGVPVWDDVASLGASGRDRGEPEGGVAANGRGAPEGGLAGARSGLFHEFARIAESLRPRWLLVENVPGLLSSNGGRDFGVVLATLADIGYGVAWRIVDSRYFGVPQRRRRVFIVGTLAVGDPRAAAERAGKILAVGTSCERHPPSGREAGPDIAVASLSGLGNGGPDDNDGQAGRLVASTLKGQRGKGGGGIGVEETLIADTVRSHPRPGSNSNGNLAVAFASKGGGGGAFSDDGIAPTLTSPGDGRAGGGQPPAVSSVASVRRLTPTECERLQALPDGWTNPDGKAPDSRRYAGLGDAVMASVGAWLGERLIRYG